MIFLITYNIILGNFKSNENLLPLNLLGRFPLFSLITEYFISFFLITGAFSLYLEWRWGIFLSLLSLVFLIYLSLKNFPWGDTENGRMGYTILSIIGFIGGAVSIIILILRFQ